MSLNDKSTMPLAEREAIAYVEKVGLERVKRERDELHAKADNRRATFAFTGGIPVVHSSGYDYLTPEERDLEYKLRLGIQLCDLSNSPAAAKERIRERLKRRKQAREVVS